MLNIYKLDSRWSTDKWSGRGGRSQPRLGRGRVGRSQQQARFPEGVSGCAVRAVRTRGSPPETGTQACPAEGYQQFCWNGQEARRSSFLGQWQTGVASVTVASLGASPSQVPAQGAGRGDWPARRPGLSKASSEWMAEWTRVLAPELPGTCSSRLG